jgi:hypothetical protein
MAEKEIPEQLLLGEVQVLLAEKRTYLSFLRTGSAVMTVPPTIVLFLIATASYHGIFNFFWLGVVVVSVLIGVSFGGLFISYQSYAKIRKINTIIGDIEKTNARVDQIVV